MGLLSIDAGTEPKETTFRSQDYRDAFRSADFKGNPEQLPGLKEDLQKQIGNVALVNLLCVLLYYKYYVGIYIFTGFSSWNS